MLFCGIRLRFGRNSSAEIAVERLVHRQVDHRVRHHLAERSATMASAMRGGTDDRRSIRRGHGHARRRAPCERRASPTAARSSAVRAASRRPAGRASTRRVGVAQRALNRTASALSRAARRRVARRRRPAVSTKSGWSAARRPTPGAVPGRTRSATAAWRAMRRRASQPHAATAKAISRRAARAPDADDAGRRTQRQDQQERRQPRPAAQPRRPRPAARPVPARRRRSSTVVSSGGATFGGAAVTAPVVEPRHQRVGAAGSSRSTVRPRGRSDAPHRRRHRGPRHDAGAHAVRTGDAADQHARVAPAR